MRFFFLFFLLGFGVESTTAQQLTKEEKKRLKQELKNYLNDVEGYHALMVDFQSRITGGEAKIKELQATLKLTSANQRELEKKVSFCDSVILSMQQENTILKGDPVSTTISKSKKTTAIKSAPNHTEKAPINQRGVVYKVQIGAYRRFNINEYFNEPRCIGHEEVKGMNRYNIGYFTEENTAKEFMSDIRRMGIKDAFVTKYVDGKRDYSWSPDLVRARRR